jgi:hypothetical protein
MSLMRFRIDHRRGGHVSIAAETVALLFQLNPALRACESCFLAVMFMSHTSRESKQHAA